MNKRSSHIFGIALCGLVFIVGCTGDLAITSPVTERSSTVEPIETLLLTPNSTSIPDTPLITMSPHTPDVSLGANHLPDEEAPVAGTIEASGTPSVLFTPFSALGADPRPSETPSLLPALTIEKTVDMQCQGPPQKFDLTQIPDLSSVNGLSFESEELITFEGWVNRLDPSIFPQTPEPTPDSFPIPNSSSRYMLIGGQIDLSVGTVSLRPLDVDPPLFNPCDEECPLEVLSQSPDNQWQLVQVNDWLQAKMGLWLVSTESAIRLVPYVPFNPRWQWAEDSSMLWILYYHEGGGETLVYRLGDPPDANEVMVGNLLDPLRYWAGYSPIDKAAYAVPAPSMGDELTIPLYIIDLEEGAEVPSETWSVKGVESFAWNEATKSMTAQIVSDAGIQFQELPGGMSLTIPNETLAEIFPSITRAIDDLPTGISASGDWAFSPSGEKLALLNNPRVLLVFNCVPAY